jgi:hypothetical protein
MYAVVVETRDPVLFDAFDEAGPVTLFLRAAMSLVKTC